MTAPPSVPEQVLARAAAGPARVAVAGPGAPVTYGALAARAGALARRLVTAGVGPGDVVAVLGADADAVTVAPLATWLAGAAVMPLGTGQPAARLRTLLTAARVRAVLAPGGTAGCDPGVAVLDPAGAGTAEARAGTAEAGAGTAEAGAPALPGPRPEGAAYVLFTSGSSGTPKGVVVAHAAFARHVRAMTDHLGLTEGDVSLQFASPAFDVALEETWTALAGGGRLVLRAAELWAPRELVAATAAHGITVWQLPTAFWSQAVTGPGGLADLAPPPTLRCVVIGSEAADRRTARRWLASPWRGIRLVNAYGPTEAVVTATVYDVTEDRAAPGALLPIGRPLPGRDVHVLDADLRPVPPGEPGELWLSGPCLAEGYLHAPAETAAAFVRLPSGPRAFRTGDRVLRGADGVLDFLGRQDRQVKVAGTRVELAEVECVLAECPGVLAAAVAPVTDGPTAHLAAWVTSPWPAARWSALAAEVRRYAEARLPPGVAPRTVQVRDTLPVTGNGKVDYRPLTDPAPPSPRPLAHPDAAPDAAPADLFDAAEAKEFLTEFFAEAGSPPAPGRSGRWLTAVDGDGTRLTGPGRERWMTALVGLTDPDRLGAALRLLLDTSARLTARRAPTAARQLASMAAALSPVVVAVGLGRHPVAGWAAAALRGQDGRLGLDVHGSRWISVGPPTRPDHGRAVRDLAELAAGVDAVDGGSAAARALRELAGGRPPDPGVLVDVEHSPRDTDRSVRLVRALGRRVMS
ncbi:amino acid adenylation domain-containing protein [Streptomyces sp. NPDC003522]